MTFNRRQMLRTAGAGLLVPATLRGALASQAPTKRVLYFTKSSGFQHSVVTRQGEELAHSERILTEIGKLHGFEVVASKDGRMFDPDKIGQWDAFVFYTTGDLTQPGTDKQPPMSEDGKKAFLDAIRGGKGFVGMHCATDTFHSSGDQVDPYIQMIGGEFAGHGAQQEARIDVVDESFPGAESFQSEFRLLDEWYTQKNLSDDLHVIMVQVTEGMEGDLYQARTIPRPGPARKTRAASSTRRWATARTSGRTPDSRASSSAASLGDRTGRRRRHAEHLQGHSRSRELALIRRHDPETHA